MAADGMVMTWDELGAQVESGGLYLEPDVARKCASHCADLVGQLEQMRRTVQWLARVDGLGTFPSGIALAEKFGRKASGGDYSMYQALADHIAEVQRMQMVFEKIDAMYTATEESTTQGITSVGSGF